MLESNTSEKDSQTINGYKMEKCVIDAIRKILKSRSRPCFQNVLADVNRCGNSLTMERLKELVNILMEKNICDKGRKGVSHFIF